MRSPDKIWIKPAKVAYIPESIAQAAVAAALEAAAGEAQMHADHWRKAWETAKSNSSPKEARDWQTMMLGGLFVKDSIRALITQRDHDALAAHVAAEVARARAEIYAQIEAMPRREELLGGQRTEYIQLHEALAWIGAKQ